MSSEIISFENNSSSAIDTSEVQSHDTNTMSALDSSTNDFKQFVYLIAEQRKADMVINLMMSKEIDQAIVYVKTNFAADDLADTLNRAGVTAESYHENKSHRTQVRSLTNFRTQSTSVLVATESAVSEICVAKVNTIINYDLPVSAETYLERIKYHRNGATSSAKAFSLCNKSEQRHLSNINRALRGEIEVLDHSLVA